MPAVWWSVSGVAGRRWLMPAIQATAIGSGTGMPSRWTAGRSLAIRWFYLPLLFASSPCRASILTTWARPVVAPEAAREAVPPGVFLLSHSCSIPVAFLSESCERFKRKVLQSLAPGLAWAGY